MRLPAHLGYLLRRGRRQEEDRCAAAGVNWRNHSIDLPPGLELQWLGAAGFRLSYQGTHLLIDPYITRVGLGALLRRRALHGSPELVARHVKAADAVLLGHTHFDHAVDVPLIARRFGCPAYGSASLQQLMRLHGLEEQAVVVQPHRPYRVGPFSVTFVPSRHSRLGLGRRPPFNGELTCDRLDRLYTAAYRCGRIHAIHVEVAGTSFYHLGSADLDDDEVRHRGVDYLLACIVGRGATPRYWERALGRLQPRVLVPHHHDNFLRPLDRPMAFAFDVDFAGMLDEVRTVSPELAIRALDPLQTVVG